MLTIDVEYIDYVNDDKASRETMRFNLNAWELSKLIVQFPEGMGEAMEKALKDNDQKTVFKILELVFVNAYGRRIRREGDLDKFDFVKDPAWLIRLLPSPEFEAFYLRLTTDTEFAKSFWNGIVTPELLKRANELANTREPETSPEQNLVDLSLEEKIRRLQAEHELQNKKAANEV